MKRIRAVLVSSVGIIALFLLIRFNGSSSLQQTLVDILGLSAIPFVVNHTSNTKDRLLSIEDKTNAIQHQTNGELTAKLNEIKRELRDEIRDVNERQKVEIVNAICNVVTTWRAGGSINQLRRRLLQEMRKGKR